MTLNNHSYTKKKPIGTTLFFLLLILLSTPPKTFAAGIDVEERDGRCNEVIEMLKAQKSEMSKELRLIKREIAVVKTRMEKPGITEIIGGIGYILGLFGIGYYIYARNILKAKK